MWSSLSRIVRPAIALFVLTLVIARSVSIEAHNIPTDVTVQTYVKAEGTRLRLLVRVPLSSLKDAAWPLKTPGVLDTGRAAPVLSDAAMRWIGNRVVMFEGARPLPAPTVAAVRATAPADGAFASYERAIGLVTGPPPTGDIAISSGLLDVLFEYPIQSADSRFSILPRWGNLGENPVVAIRLVTRGGAIRAFEVRPWMGTVQLDPSFFQSAKRFVRLGFEHILSGTDHLLFLFALVIPFRRFRQLLVLVTAFTVAHSITLIASAYNLAPAAGWFSPLVEVLIAASIVYMTIENMIGVSLHRRWMITFGFGLVHGFGFSFALKQTLQFAGAHLLTSLLSFNVGVELGQMLVLGVMLPLLALTFRFVAERVGVVSLSALVALVGGRWLLERLDVLRRYPFARPELTPTFLVDVLGWVVGVLAVGGAVWLIGTRLAKSGSRPGAIHHSTSRRIRHNG